MKSILLFDFDGTIALGDGPVLAYAQRVATALDDPGFVDGIRSTLDAADGALDGYDAVRRAAEERGADAALLSLAYLDSRARLATADAPITAPAGLAAFLGAAEGLTERVLATNAPSIRIPEALDALGLTGLFDRVITDARKPAGLETVLEALPAGVRVLSIGDIWRNDLAPAHARGHATALIGGFADAAAAPTYRASTFVELIPRLEDWLRTPDSLPSATSLTPTSHIEG